LRTINENDNTNKTVAHNWKRFIDWAKPLRLSHVTPESMTDFKRRLLQEE